MQVIVARVTGGGNGIGQAWVSLDHKLGAEVATTGRTERNDIIAFDVGMLSSDGAIQYGDK